MPVIRIDFDSEKVAENDVAALSQATQKIVSEVTAIEDVFVYANNSQIKIKVAPIEIFVQISSHKIKNLDALVNDIKFRLSEWKREQKFPHLINLTVTPMSWKIEIGI